MANESERPPPGSWPSRDFQEEFHVMHDEAGRTTTVSRTVSHQIISHSESDLSDVISEVRQTGDTSLSPDSFRSQRLNPDATWNITERNSTELPVQPEQAVTTTSSQRVLSGSSLRKLGNVGEEGVNWSVGDGSVQHFARASSQTAEGTSPPLSTSVHDEPNMKGAVEYIIKNDEGRDPGSDNSHAPKTGAIGDINVLNPTERHETAQNSASILDLSPSGERDFPLIENGNQPHSDKALGTRRSSRDSQGYRVTGFQKDSNGSSNGPQSTGAHNREGQLYTNRSAVGTAMTSDEQSISPTSEPDRDSKRMSAKDASFSLFGGEHRGTDVSNSTSSVNRGRRISTDSMNYGTKAVARALSPESRAAVDRSHGQGSPSHGTQSHDYAAPLVTAAGDTKSITGAAKRTSHEQDISRVLTDEEQPQRPRLNSKYGSKMTEDDLFKVLSQRNTRTSRQNSYATSNEEGEEVDEIQRLMSTMFGQNRQAQSEEEKTRHVGVVFKNLVVKGQGLGAALQPTLGDPLMAPYRLILSCFSRSWSISRGKNIRTLIHNFNGCIRPGEMLLVLGRPGSGCSTFLKVLGNQRFGYESIEGDVDYGGVSAHKMAKDYRGEVLYNPEDDLHYATLSVKNTLKFALRTKTPGKESRVEGETKSQYVSEFLRVVTKLFWIEHTLNTKVGDEYVRGVSGGEKKRVSIAEAMITKASTQAWDNSTRGLDASTALEYVQSIRSLTNMAHVSTAVALYQAGESLYNLFDKVILIDEGRCLYYGPTEGAAAYFEGLGFERPPRWTTADFLTSVSDPHERKVREGWEDRIPQSAEQFEAAYSQSQANKDNHDDIREFEAHLEAQRRERQAAQTKATKKKNYTIPFHKQVWVCTKRQFLVMIGDKQSLGGKWGGILFQALIVGSLFYNQPKTSAGVFTRGGVMFFMLLFNALLALAELTAAFGSRPILLKHKSFLFYRPAAYAIAQTVVDIPLVLIQVFIFDIVVYFMSNLQRTASQFFISLFILWTLTMTMYAFFRAIGALVASLDVATRITGVAIQALIVYTGYLIPPGSMHPWFKWLMYINPVAYGFEALMANEFYNLDIMCEPPYLVPIGPQAQPQYQSCLVQGSRPGQITVSGADYIKTAFDYSRAHLWRNIGFIYAFFVFFVCLTMFGMEIQKPNKGGGAVTIFKRGQAPSSVEKAIQKGDEAEDEEKAAVAHGRTRNASPDDSSSSSNGQAAKKVAKNETVFTWQNVNYTIPTKEGERMLLQDVQGYVRPGKLTALMGASGAGKTTLLNTLAQRINFGVITGDFLIDGRPLPRSFQRATGFAEQMDVHEPTATVREALRFSALLRQPKSVPVSEKYAYCETIIDLLEMRNIAGAVIGVTGSGLNQEQRKRLTIGVELASKPELLMFLDEPTSGLDSAAAFNIVRFLRKLADAGQAILCTIHQPSSVLFEEFDDLILLQYGGRIVYHGELGKDSQHLIHYFESNGGKKCSKKANPAEYMLEVIGGGDPNYKGKNWGDVWAESSNKAKRTKEIQELIKKRRVESESTPKVDDSEFAMPLITQIWAVTKRNYINVWRDQNYMVGKFMLHIVTGLFNCFTFYKVGYASIDMQNRLFSIFMTLTISPPLIQQLQPKFLNFRQLFSARERNSKVYSWVAFVIGAIAIEIPYCAVAGTIYMMCWWWGSVGWRRSSFDTAYTWLLLMQFELFYVGLGQAIAAFSPNELPASLLVPIFFTFVISFAGIVVPYVALPTFWRSWMYYLTPFTYLLEGLLAAATHGLRVQCAENELARFTPPPGVTCENYTRDFVAMAGGYVQEAADGMCEFCQYATGDEFAASFNVFWSPRWRDYGIFWAFIIFNFAVVFVASYFYLVGGRKLKNYFTRKDKQKNSHNQHSANSDTADKA